MPKHRMHGDFVQLFRGSDDLCMVPLSDLVSVSPWQLRIITGTSGWGRIDRSQIGHRVDEPLCCTQRSFPL
jgi:hypothetical protein